MYKKIGDYGIIGNFHTIALVGRDGSIDWMCLPHLDSSSIFAALLDDRKGGCFRVCPEGEWDSTSSYISGTNVLVTTFRASSGNVKLTDFMPVSRGTEREAQPERHELYRLIEAVEGEPDVRLLFAPRFDYARSETRVEKAGAAFVASGGNQRAVLCSSRTGLEINGDRVEGRWRLAGGERVWLHLYYGLHGPYDLDPDKARRLLESAGRYWREWLATNETGIEIDPGPFRWMIDRSALVLKLLIFKPSGAVAAAATTSLPEVIGGDRNWDYRFSWVRDSSMTVEALNNLGHLSEMEDYFRWIEGIIGGGRRLQVLYGLRGETDVTETVLPHLNGYKGSRPVRIGNAAAGQMQLDIFGEFMDVAMRLSDYAGEIRYVLWPYLREICDTVADCWTAGDSGIWEVRGGPFQFVYSKVMCWVALDRGLAIARRHGFPADREKWESVRDSIRKNVLEKGWNNGKRSFVQHYGTDELDASALLIPAYGFLPFDDPRVVATAEALSRELSVDGLFYRYRSDDALAGREGAFLACTFWYVQYLIARGMLYDAELLLLRTEKCANCLGLFAEQYDPVWKESLGNFPQALTHIGYINCVLALIRAKAKKAAC
ncbi:MAG TPA: glycoside hydrolase family 15 protein [Geobacteraceae bacterium]|nr:glycoside hydrolase family 15 protein [Geobacteraceae bacterium]